NAIDADVSATIDNADDLDAAGVTVLARQDSTIDATGAAASVALAASYTNSTGIGGAGAMVFNKIIGTTVATIVDSDIDAGGLTGGEVKVEALNSADIDSTVIAAAVTIGGGLTGSATGVAIGISLAF